MKLLPNERERIRGVAERWKNQYCANGKWSQYAVQHLGGPEAVYDRLMALDLEVASAEDVRIAMKLPGPYWTSPQLCTECTQTEVETEAIIQVGEEPDIEASYVYLCLKCAHAVLALARSVG